MAIPFSALALFCEDIREEKTGAVTLVGVVTDNVAVPASGGTIPKLGFFIRMNFDPNDDPGEGTVRVVHGNGKVDEPARIEASTTALACKQARETGAPMAGVISRFVAQNFPANPGRLRVEVAFRNFTYLAGSLHIQIAP